MKNQLLLCSRIGHFWLVIPWCFYASECAVDRGDNKILSLFSCRDFAQKLASALAHNPNSGLHTINLASNPLEDRGIVTVTFLFSSFYKCNRRITAALFSFAWIIGYCSVCNAIVNICCSQMTENHCSSLVYTYPLACWEIFKCLKPTMDFIRFHYIFREFSFKGR